MIIVKENTTTPIGCKIACWCITLENIFRPYDDKTNKCFTHDKFVADYQGTLKKALDKMVKLNEILEDSAKDIYDDFCCEGQSWEEIASQCCDGTFEGLRNAIKNAKIDS